MCRRLVVLAVVLVGLFHVGLAAAAPNKELVVGTHPIAPFVIKNPDGSWGGISIDIWKRAAEDLHLCSR